MSSSATVDLWTAIALSAERESSLWSDALRPESERELEPVFSPLADPRYALAVETIYEGYLAHYGRPRLFAAPDRDTALLLGDYLYAQGIVELAATGSVEAVTDMAELISLCAHLRGQGSSGDGDAWVSTVGGLSGDAPADSSSVGRALATHRSRVG
ncbi:MAG: hypothetical protein ACRDKU_04050 [Gaiellaceae bacterium]